VNVLFCCAQVMKVSTRRVVASVGRRKLVIKSTEGLAGRPRHSFHQQDDLESEPRPCFPATFNSL